MEAIKVLQNKVKGTVLFDSVLGENVLFERLEGNRIICSNNNKEQTYKGNGKLFDNTDAIVVLTPSRKMRDWSKFAWKKGDILLCDENKLCIFDKWANEDYTEIEVKYTMPDYGNAKFKTSSCYKETNEFVIKKYVSLIELTKGGKLNLSTLQIEKQPEFKDGDIVAFDKSVAICRHISEHTIYFYACISKTWGLMINDNSVSGSFRLANDSEKQQLFDALAKKNKRWDEDKKMLVDLSKKHKFEAFQKVLTRDTLDEKWRPNLFSNYNREGSEYMYGCIYGGCDAVYSKYCIPYNDSTKHLLGTTDEWKGGEG